jgi:hypothetical protein
VARQPDPGTSGAGDGGAGAAGEGAGGDLPIPWSPALPGEPRRTARRTRAPRAGGPGQGGQRYVWLGIAVAALAAGAIGWRWLNGVQKLARYHHYQDLTARQCYALPRQYLQGCLYGAALQLADPQALAESTAARRRLYARYAAGGPFPRADCVLLPTDSVEGCVERTSPAGRAPSG